jgi:membrane associated rhomboid family serine protease
MAKDKFELHYIFGFIASIFLIHIACLLWAVNYDYFCLLPRSPEHVTGIFTMPLMHHDFEHLFSNIFSYLIVSFVLFSVYPRVAKWVFWMGYIGTGILVWFIGRGNACHIGASGLVYAISFFLLASGFLRKDLPSLMSAMVVVFFNQGLLAGMLPIESKISWEGHLSGAIVGIICAYIFRHYNRSTHRVYKRIKVKRKRFFEDFPD